MGDYMQLTYAEEARRFRRNVATWFGGALLVGILMAIGLLILANEGCLRLTVTTCNLNAVIDGPFGPGERP